MTSTPDDEARAADRWLTPGVLGVGGASLCSDTGHELVTSVLPTFLTSTLHAGPGALGAVEGVADALTGLSKLAGGPLANDPRRRARLASGGYVGTALATAAIGLTVAVWQVAVLRALAWMSRGIRTPARDSLLVSLVPRRSYGRATGVERAGDNAGALLGPLLAAVLVAAVGVRHAILLAVVPGLLAAVSITAAAREARRTAGSPAGGTALRLNLRAVAAAGLPRALIPVALFEIGNLATTLLILRATDLLHTGTRSLTAATSVAILLYAAHNGVAAAASPLAGQLVDRIGPRAVLTAGAALYAGAYTVFAFDQRAWPVLLLAFGVAGAGIGLAETAESTTVALLLPDRLRGSGFAVLGLVQAVGDLGASLVAGLLWSAFSPAVAFGYAAAWMLAATATAATLRSRPFDAGRAGN